MPPLKEIRNNRRQANLHDHGLDSFKHTPVGMPECVFQYQTPESLIHTHSKAHVMWQAQQTGTTFHVGSGQQSPFAEETG
jgi:hypothetical protein